MTASKHASGYVPNPGYTQEDWDEVSDNPELTDEEIARLRPASEVLPPALYEGLQSLRRARGPQKAPTKAKITLRLDRLVIEHFRATGDGWQRRINDALLEAIRDKGR